LEEAGDETRWSVDSSRGFFSQGSCLNADAYAADEYGDAFDDAHDSDGETMEEAVTEVYNMLESMSLSIIRLVCQQAQIEEDKVVDMLDKDRKLHLSSSGAPRKKDEIIEPIGSDVFRIYQYLRPADSPLPGLRDPATGIHADMGLITLSPAANIPGLMVLGQDGVSWLDVESSRPDAPNLTPPSSSILTPGIGFKLAAIRAVSDEPNLAKAELFPFERVKSAGSVCSAAQAGQGAISPVVTKQLPNQTSSRVGGGRPNSPVQMDDICDILSGGGMQVGGEKFGSAGAGTGAAGENRRGGAGGEGGGSAGADRFILMCGETLARSACVCVCVCRYVCVCVRMCVLG